MPDNASNQIPPIPPNHPNFTDQSFWFDSFEYTANIPLAKVDPEWRPVIAAVAEVAWLKEYDRVNNGGDPPTSWPRDRVVYLFHCASSSRAWRAWGDRTEADHADR